MLGISIPDCRKTVAKHIKSASTSGEEAADDRVIKLNRVIPLPPNKRKPVKETHVVAIDAWAWKIKMSGEKRKKSGE